MTELSQGAEQKACVVLHTPTLAAGVRDAAPRRQARVDRGLWEKVCLKGVGYPGWFRDMLRDRLSLGLYSPESSWLPTVPVQTSGKSGTVSPGPGLSRRGPWVL